MFLPVRRAETRFPPSPPVLSLPSHHSLSLSCLSGLEPTWIPDSWLLNLKGFVRFLLCAQTCARCQEGTERKQEARPAPWGVSTLAGQIRPTSTAGLGNSPSQHLPAGAWGRERACSRGPRGKCWGSWERGAASPSSPYPAIKSGEANVCARQFSLSVTSSGLNCPGLKEREKKRKVLIMWLEILIPEIKFYELPIAQHPVFLTFLVSHTVF